MRSIQLRISVLCLLMTGTMLALATATQAYDPQAENCQGQVGIKDIDVKVSPTTEGAASSLKAGALLCGSDINAEDGSKSKGYLSGTIKLPITLMGKSGGWVSGIVTRCANPKFKDDPAHKADCGSTADLKEGQYIGSVGMGITTFNGLIALDGQLADIYVQKAPGTPKENSECDAKAIACYQGIDEMGIGYSDMVVKKVGPQYQLKIGKIKLISPILQGTKVYYTRIGYPEQGNPVDLCAYAGPVNGAECGNAASGDWVQKNGPAAANSCNALQGLYWPILKNEGKAGESLGGLGFRIEVESEVPGAMDWWGNDPRLKEDGWTDKYPDLVDGIVAANGENPLCAAVTIMKAGSSKPGIAFRTPSATPSRDQQASSAAQAQPQRKAAKRKVKKRKRTRSKPKHRRR